MKVTLITLTALELMERKKQKIVQGRTHANESVVATHSDGDTAME
jgi:hypothetical protein